MKEGKWSAGTAASLSNDEFFDLLGIPELTAAKAAHAKGLPGPLIENRDGCHVWKPENFPKDDPRHGWTWEDCWKDATTQMGTESSVRVYRLDGSLNMDDNDHCGEGRPSHRPARATSTGCKQNLLF